MMGVGPSLPHGCHGGVVVNMVEITGCAELLPNINDRAATHLCAS